MTTIRLGSKTISSSGDFVYIIAEIGQNHQGSIELAKQMILEAKRAGCHCVKFQKSCLSAKFTAAALDRRYDGENSWGTTYGEHKKYLEFSLEQYKDLKSFCVECEIDFTASAMDEQSLKFLDELDVPFIKIGSGDANNFPMLEKSAELARPLLISTGMQTMETVQKIVDIMKANNKTNYALLHCVSAYPTDPSDANLLMITMLQHKYPNVLIGYSGHEMGMKISTAAVLLGARVVERHFTLDKNQKGSDHKCSLDSKDMQQLVQDIAKLRTNQLLNRIHNKNEILRLLDATEDVDQSLKTIEHKTILPCELSCKLKLGKSIVAAKYLKLGQVLQSDDICIKVSEPNGIHAEKYDEILGAVLKTDVNSDAPIMYSHIKL